MSLHRRKRRSPEQIIVHLREAVEGVGGGEPAAEEGGCFERKDSRSTASGYIACGSVRG